MNICVSSRDKLTKDKAAGILVTPSARKERAIKKPSKSNYVSSDALFIDGYRQSLGTIIGRCTRSCLSTLNKSSYFKKVLGMNITIGLSDPSDASHMNMFSSSKAQAGIQELFSMD